MREPFQFCAGIAALLLLVAVPVRAQSVEDSVLSASVVNLSAPADDSLGKTAFGEVVE